MCVSSDTRPVAVPAGLATLAFVAGLVSVVGTYWDDSWHTDRGRDDFFIAPHVAIYGGVVVAAGVVASWWWRSGRRLGWRDPGLRPVTLAVCAVVAAFASGPIDDAWHRAFGRDAVLWSPPHLLALTATMALVVSLVAGLGTAAPRAARILGSTLVLAVLLVPVMEYEADVPQFSPAWYLPLVAAALLATRVLVGPIVGGRWPLTTVAVTYTVLRLGISALLATAGFSTPAVPLVVAVAVVIDAVATSNAFVRVGLAVFVVHLVYVPWSRIAPHATPVLSGELLLSIAAASVAAVAVLAVSREFRLRPLPIAAAVAVVLFLAMMPPAVAHDPGQGPSAGKATLIAQVSDRRIMLTVEMEECPGLRPAAVVARRAGITVSQRLEPLGAACGFGGTVAVPRDGRWFVYATFDRVDGEAEAWLPVEAGTNRTTRIERELYEPPDVERSGVKTFGGAVLLVVSAALVASALSLRPNTRAVRE